MHVHRIEIENFRNFRRLVVEGLPAAAVVVGENGTGKSNLLAGLRLVLDPSLPDTQRHLQAEDFWDGLSAPFAGEAITVRVDLAGFDDDEEAKGVLGDGVVAEQPIVARLHYEFRPRQALSGDVSAGDYEFTTYLGTEAQPVPFGADVRRFVSLQVLPALRDAEGDLQTWSRSPLAQLLELLDIPSARLDEVAEQARAATAALLEESQVAALQEALNERLAAMVGHVFGTDVSLGVAAARSDQVLRAVRLLVDASRDVSRTSLGSANVLYLALLLERVSALRRHGQLVSRLLGVEEPEAHLHPQLQRVLFHHLVRAHPELLLTTHSAHVASVTPLSSLLLLRSTDEGTIALRPPLDELSEPEQADLERYLDVTRADMLFARGVILVEGAAELYLVPAFARARGYDLDALGISVSAVHGVDFAPFRTLLGEDGLDIPNVVITDGDTDRDRRGISHAGLRRGRRLLRGAAGDVVKAAIDDERYDEARELLGNAGIFVGANTLEVDLLPAGQDVMIAAYAELVSRAQTRQLFEEAAQQAPADREQRAALVKRIERVGKGRFAQRLVAHLDDAVPPSYIGDAIDRIALSVSS